MSSISFLRTQGILKRGSLCTDRDVEAEEIRAARAGCAKTRDTLFVRFAWMLASVATKYAKRSPEIDANDVFQECVFGFMDALETFDPDLGCKFSTHLMVYLRRYASRFSGWQQLEVYVPVNIVQSMLYKSAIAQDVSRGCSLTAPETKHAAKHEDLSDVHVYIATSLDDANAATFDVHAEPCDDLGLGDLDRSDVQKALDSFLSRRLPREQAMFRLYHGIPHGEGMSLQDVAGQFGVTRERVRQIIEKVNGHLRFDAKKHWDAAALFEYLTLTKTARPKCLPGTAQPVQASNS